MLESIQLVANDLDFLRQQAQMMFWIMDPERMKKEVGIDTYEPWSSETVKDLLITAFAAGVHKNEDAVFRGRTSKDRIRAEVMRISGTVSDSELAERLSTGTLAGVTRAEVNVEPVSLIRVDRLVAENLLFELVTNAVARAVKSLTDVDEHGQVPIFTFKFGPLHDCTGLEVIVANSSPGYDSLQLKRQWRRPLEDEDAGGSRGVSGVFQMRLLQSRAAAYAGSHVVLRDPEAQGPESHAGLCYVMSGLMVDR